MVIDSVIVLAAAPVAAVESGSEFDRAPGAAWAGE